MSTSLYWGPVPKEPREQSIHNLKWILAKKVWGLDDPTACRYTRVVDGDLIPYLDGIIDADNREDPTIGECAAALKSAKKNTIGLNVKWDNNKNN